MDESIDAVYEAAEEAILENLSSAAAGISAVAEMISEEVSSSGIKIHKTTEDNYVIENPDWTTILLDSLGTPFEGTTEQFWVKTYRVRSGSAMYNKLISVVSKINEKRAKMVTVDKIRDFDVLLNKEDFSLYLDVGGDFLPFSNEEAAKLKGKVKELERVKVEMWKASMQYRLSDRVMLYGPTGSGKTFEFLDTVHGMMQAGELDDFYVVPITEWFEDLDFLAHIVPSEKGITYVENQVVTLLRQASEGKRVAVLLDELNRGSKSFLNLVLKLLDAVDGSTYVLNNFVKNETIVIPIQNIMFFATMNLGGKYVGTNILDEALFDRFNIVQYKGYNLQVEDKMLDGFLSFKPQALQVVSYIREIHKDGEIRAPISTRGVKMWTERFLNSGKSKEDVIQTFQTVLMHRLVSVDDFGNPNESEIAIIVNKFRELSLV